MKKLSLIFTTVVFIFLCAGAKAQTNADYFAGKWKVTVTGTPQGDSKMDFVFEKKDGKLTGTLRDSTDKEISKITQIDEKDKTITAYFNTQGYDVTLELTPVDADNAKGNIMGMFDAKAIRIKDEKKENK
ncbi:hypothetical protein SNE26_09190 [Mucilaginibacter sp. cycad4]|uniref:hypothetical protein n=1 Tax=Mucilaginibacter sp. cycad4 TaxID=3342096 RepID=UPI002AABF170|nr:hypothetical protein [Mucilaginibacter gossypii]WPV01947.1 hypothetical protein SNE26_09190 [Mucilaginibacter gossypii]